MRDDSTVPVTDERTHDYTVREWGHDFRIRRPAKGGEFLDVYGWGAGIKAGDFLILPVHSKHYGDSTTRYQVDRINYQADPPDMWFAKLRFAPR
jgi:hypothetical protein